MFIVLDSVPVCLETDIMNHISSEYELSGASLWSCMKCTPNAKFTSL
jgi:hypothetical protein